MESRHCVQDKGIFFCPVHNASTPCSLQAFGIRCIVVARRNGDATESRGSWVSNGAEWFIRLSFTLSSLLCFPYVSSLIRIGHPQPIYLGKAYEII